MKREYNNESATKDTKVTKDTNGRSPRPAAQAAPAWQERTTTNPHADPGRVCCRPLLLAGPPQAAGERPLVRFVSFVAGAVFVLLTATAAAQFSLVSVEQEVEIGRQVNAQVRKEVPELRDAQVSEYIRSIGQRLVRQAPGPKYPYSFSVANYREINAFALPGGPVWIHRGVLHAATNESQVASVVAHEVAHIAQRHAADQLTKAMVANLGLGLLGAVLGNGGGASAAQMAAAFLTNGIFLKFSRDDEREADAVGLQLMRRAGWDARGMVELFEILQREGRRNPSSVEVFFSSHPPPQDRISRLRAEAGGGGGTRDTPRFQAIKARLQRMSPPRAMPRQ